MVPSFYPNIFLYLWAFFSFIFKPIKSYYCWIIVIVYLTLLISYYSMYNFCKSKSRSFIFSLIYTFTQDFWFSLLHDCRTGEYLAYMLMPMVFLGFYKLVFDKKHNGLLLGVSYSLLIYAHFVSVYLCLLIFIFIFIAGILLKKVDFSKKLLINILKTTFLIILLSLWVILPVIINFHYENIFVPKSGFWEIDSIKKIFCFAPTIYGYHLGLILFITEFIGIFFVFNHKKELSIFLLGVFLTLMSTSVFPYSHLHNGIIYKLLSPIQFPFRFLNFADLFISITASYIFYFFIKRITNKKIIYFIISLLSLIILSISFIGGKANNLDPLYSYSSIGNKNLTKYVAFLPKAGNKNAVLPPKTLLINNDNYKNIFDYQLADGQTDYWPAKSVKYYNSLINHESIINGHKQKFNFDSKPNQFNYKIHLNDDSTVDLPILVYNGTKLLVNGLQKNFSVSRRGTILVNLKPGINNLKITYRNSIFYWMFRLISIFTWIILVTLLIYKHYFKNDNS